MGLIGLSHHDFGGSGFRCHEKINVEAENNEKWGQNAVLMSVIMTRYTDTPCNHPQVGVLKDKQDFVQNEWV